MNTKTIKSIDELPDWFDINKYNETINLDAFGWMIELLYRTDDKKYAPHTLLHEPAMKTFNEETSEYINLNKIDLLAGLPSVKSLNLECAYGFYWWLSDDEKNKINVLMEEADKTGADCEDLSGSYDESISSQGLSNDGNVNVVINLNVSNEQIFKELDIWLKEARARLNEPGRKKDFNKNDYISWYNAGVLPYIDLTRWARNNNVKIPLHVMGEAIFPSANAGNKAERIRKTTKKLAFRLISNETINMLDRQYQAELISTNKGEV